VPLLLRPEDTGSVEVFPPNLVRGKGDNGVGGATVPPSRVPAFQLSRLPALSGVVGRAV